MIRLSPWLPCSLAFALLLLSAACNRKETLGVEYRKQSGSATATTVAEVFGGQVLPPEKVDPEIEALLLRIGNASRATGGTDLKQLFSIEAMIEALESGGMLRQYNRSERRSFETGFRKGIEKMNNSLEQMAFDRHRIMRVEAPSETTRVIFVRHYDTELNLSFPMRWWLVKTEAGWRVFDLQDFSTGLRSVELMGILLRAGVGAKAEPWVNDFIPALTLMRSLDLDDPEQYAKLEIPMEELRKHQMPNSIRSFASTMMVGIFQVSERNSEARAELEAALAGGYNSPLWHYQMAGCLVGEERYDDAIKELEEHADAFGWDSDSLEMLADCHFNAGRLEESRAAALRGLEDCPGTAACLASLAAASTPDQLRDPATAAHFALSTDPESSFEIALDYLITLESTEKALALFEVLRAAHPESDLIPYYEEELGLASEE